MIHTYKRKGTSPNTFSYYERLWGDSMAECSAYATHTEDRMPNGRCSSRDNEEAKCKEWSESDLPNHSNFFQSQLSERSDAPPIKFKYTRRKKELRNCGRSPHHVASLPLLLEESQSISDMKTTQPDLGGLCCDSCSLNHCRNDEPKGWDGNDGSSDQNCVELRGTKWAAPLQTYSRRSRDNNDTHRTYAALMAERSNFVASDRSFSGSAQSLENKAVPKIIELGESELVNEYSPSFSQSLEKLTDRVSSVSSMMCGQGNQMVRNGCRLIDDTNVSKIPPLNDEAVTDQLHDDAINPHYNIYHLSLHTVGEESSTDTAMPDTSEAVLDKSQNHSDDLGKAGAASKDFSGDTAYLDCSVQEVSYSDKPSKVDANLAASTKCQEAVPLESEPRQQSAEIIPAASLHTQDTMASPKELLESTRRGIKESNGLFDINAQPSKDAVSVSLRKKMAYPISSPNDSSHTRVLQLFPEVTTDNALRHNTSNSGLVPAVSSNSCSVTVALPNLSINRRDIIQDKMAESSSSQSRHKLLLDGIRSCYRPQMEETEGFRQNFQHFTNFWCEEELDNLWVGVRRHGKDNWYAILKDPRLWFSPCRTVRDLAEKWIIEQTKLLGNTPGPQEKSAKPVGILLDSYRSSVPPFVPPGPGFMTRFLTDPMQLSLNNAYLNKRDQGTFPPRPPHNFANVPGNGTRLFNRRIRARRKSQRSENTWGRFKMNNQVMPPPQFPTRLASTSRINILPNVRDALHCPNPLPPLPVPPLSVQHFTQFHDNLTNMGISNSRQNGFHLSSTITDGPNVAAFPKTQTSEAKPPVPMRQKELINLESEASSEGTISDDKPTFICK